MSEVKSRPSGSRGRGSTRGGRGGSSLRGRAPRSTGGKADGPDLSSNYEDEGEIGELKSTYHRHLGTIKEMFPDWTDEDIVFALQETDGDLDRTIDRITEGNMSQWGEVKKKTKDRSQSKQPKDTTAAADSTAPAGRGGRGRGGSEVARGGRGRGIDRGGDRGRGAPRAGRGARAITQPNINGHGSTGKAQKESSDAIGSWDTATTDTGSTPMESSWEHVTAESAQASPPQEQKAAPADPPKTWAAMFAKPKPAPAPKAPKAAPSHDVPTEPPIAVTAGAETAGLPPPTSEQPITPPVSDLGSLGQTVEITPPKDDLTETNLEKLPDNSAPVASATVASTAASTVDQRLSSGTPLVNPQQKDRPPLGGYATTAFKATGMPGRSASYQRKIVEQQEAVVMPGKHAVDKTAVQFGSMGLNGASEGDVDSDREDAETREQPPQHSPVAPRASLPPAPAQQQGLPNPPQPSEMQPPLRQAPGLPPISQAPFSHNPSAHDHQAPSQLSQSYAQYGDRYGVPSSQPENVAPSQKPYEPFGQQLQGSSHYDPFHSAGYGGLSQEQRQYLESKASSGMGAPSAYQTSDDSRPPFQSQYGYGQPSHSGPEAASAQPRTSSAIGSSSPNQPAQQPAHARFGQQGEAQGSGHSTPYGSMGQQPGSHVPGQHGGYGYGAGYPYGGYYSQYGMSQMGRHNFGGERPTYDDARRYDQQDTYAGFQYGGQSGYGGGHFGGGGNKGIYGQQHSGCGMSPQTSHDQPSSSPATSGAFGQQLPATGRDSALGGMSMYGNRSGSTQPQDNLHSANQGGMADAFARSGSNYGGQTQGFGGSGNDDALRGYTESKITGGPSPALGQAGGRPGSAVNPQTGLPPQDARFGAQYGGYPSHSQYGGGPGAGSHGAGNQGQQYSGYGGGGYGSNYYGGGGGGGNRGGWGANYAH